MRFYIQSRIYEDKEDCYGRLKLFRTLGEAIVILQQALAQPTFLELKSQISQAEIYQSSSRNPVFAQLESFVVSDAFIQLSAILHDDQYEFGGLSGSSSIESPFYWALVAACYIGDVSLVEYLLSRQELSVGSDNKIAKRSASEVFSQCLSMAASRGHRDLVVHLSVNHRKDCEFDIYIWGRHLWESYRNGHTEVTKVLLKEEETMDIESACFSALHNFSHLTDNGPSYTSSFGLVLDCIGFLQNSELVPLLTIQLEIGTVQTVEMLLTRLDCATLSTSSWHTMWEAASLRGPQYAVALMRHKGFWCSPRQKLTEVAWRRVARTALRAGRTDIYEEFLHIIGEDPTAVSIENLVAVDGSLEVLRTKLAENPQVLHASPPEQMNESIGEQALKLSIARLQAKSVSFFLERGFGRSSDLACISIDWQVRRTKEEEYRLVLSTLRSYGLKIPEIIL